MAVVPSKSRVQIIHWCFESGKTPTFYRNLLLILRRRVVIFFLRTRRAIFRRALINKSREDVCDINFDRIVCLRLFSFLVRRHFRGFVFSKISKKCNRQRFKCKLAAARSPHDVTILEHFLDETSRSARRAL